MDKYFIFIFFYLHTFSSQIYTTVEAIVCTQKEIILLNVFYVSSLLPRGYNGVCVIPSQSSILK